MAEIYSFVASSSHSTCRARKQAHSSVTVQDASNKKMRESRKPGAEDLDQESDSSSALRMRKEEVKNDFPREVDVINKDKPTLPPASPGRKKARKGKKEGGKVARKMMYDELIELIKQLFADFDSDLYLDT